MKREDNNPTARIGRMLEEIEELEGAYQQLMDLLPSDLLPQAPDYPRLDAIKEERARRHFTLSKVQAARRRMRTFRMGERSGENIFRQRGYKDYEPSMDAEILEGAGIDDRVREDIEKLLKE